MKNISVTGFELSGLEPPGCPTPGACSCNCGKEIEALQKQLAAAKEDAECAWRNVRILEAARVEEMQKQDEAVAMSATLHTRIIRTLQLLADTGSGVPASEIIDVLSGKRERRQ